VGEHVAETTFMDNICGQPESLRRVATLYGSPDGMAALDAAAELLHGKTLTSTGMGASLYALFATRRLLDATSPGHMIDETGYLSENLEHLSRRVQAALVVTQSGETVEAKALLAADAVRPVIVVTRDPTSSVAKDADLVLPVPCEPDLSVALQTYTSTIAVLALLASRLGGGDVKTVLDDVLRVADRVEEQIPALRDDIVGIADYLGSVGQIYAIGRGASLGSALGTALLLKEAAKRNCEGGGSAQFRHGAVEVLSPETAVIVFTGDHEAARRLDENLTAELKSYGAPVVVFGPRVPPGGKGIVVRSVSAAFRPVTEIVPAQLLADAMAHRNGVTPGEFRNAVPVISSA
jgi:glucosamine--fructose-6-phosphate aminotransferase (isomerizing)